jgi:hypothetical protein
METLLAYLDKKYPYTNVLTKAQIQKELLLKEIPKKLDRKYVPKKEVADYITNNMDLK